MTKAASVAKTNFLIALPLSSFSYVNNGDIDCLTPFNHEFYRG
jgi:hypothetical protein